ncbi:uncharacterized protein CIMG_12637 [Coccidioides immitis RS]|uniref:Uncharacterized protein n=1 Tax=Coccidioides immitis (strain RS) TaxID=246410 RepID=J3KM16_COCIM|nr:uncharacterized protein CIMG_12637 [Coccidioides immitis RS]EAS37400.3 hypothetical protein CIMG_12637 [Coccidioides immitis RS]
MNIAGNVLSLNSVITIVHCKYIIVNADDMKLVLDIDAKIGLNYFGLIDVPDCPASAATTHYLYAAPASSTTAAAASPSLSLSTTTSLPLSGAVRVSICQITDIRVLVWFTKLVLEKQKEKQKKEKKKKKKKKWKKKKEREKKNDNNNKDDNNDD